MAPNYIGRDSSLTLVQQSTSPARHLDLHQDAPLCPQTVEPAIRRFSAPPDRKAASRSPIRSAPRTGCFCIACAEKSGTARTVSSVIPASAAPGMIQTTSAILNMDAPARRVSKMSALRIGDKEACDDRGHAARPKSPARPAAPSFSNRPHFARMRGKNPPRPGKSGTIWSAESFFGQSVWLADRVVPWHTFNRFGFGPINFQACHSKLAIRRIEVAIVRPRRSASIAAGSTFSA